jgi:hypothetical protein
MPQKPTLPASWIKWESDMNEYEVDPDDLAAEAVLPRSDCHRNSFSKRLLHTAIGTVSAWRSFQPIRNWTSRRSPQSPVIAKFIWFP